MYKLYSQCVFVLVLPFWLLNYEKNIPFLLFTISVTIDVFFVKNRRKLSGTETAVRVYDQYSRPSESRDRVLLWFGQHPIFLQSPPSTERDLSSWVHCAGSGKNRLFYARPRKVPILAVLEFCAMIYAASISS